MISFSPIECAFATLHNDWKRAASFAMCGDTPERCCPWRVPDVDCCLHKAAKWSCLTEFVANQIKSNQILLFKVSVSNEKTLAQG